MRQKQPPEVSTRSGSKYYIWSSISENHTLIEDEKILDDDRKMSTIFNDFFFERRFKF